MVDSRAGLDSANVVRSEGDGVGVHLFESVESALSAGGLFGLNGGSSRRLGDDLRIEFALAIGVAFRTIFQLHQVLLCDCGWCALDRLSFTDIEVVVGALLDQ